MTPLTSKPLIEDWDLLRSFLPANWEDLAARTGALRKLRKDKSPDSLLRTLLLHLACGHSLRETVVRARRANLADLSDVALLKRLRKSRDWLQALCIELLREQGWATGASAPGGEVRALDGTTVQEPGRTGSLWRVHYSLRLPSLTCDFFQLTRTKGEGTGESLTQFPIAAGDKVLAERGYSTGRGIRHVTDAGGQVTVRVNHGALRWEDRVGERLDLVESMRPLRRPGMIGSLPASVLAGKDGTVPGRVCALRKTEEATRIAVRKARREASSKGRTVKPATLELAQYVILFTTVPKADWSAAEVFRWCRTRWHAELVFKRFKSRAQLGALPKHHDDSAKAWQYGKLLVALLVGKLTRHASSISPWGYDLAPEAATPCLA